MRQRIVTFLLAALLVAAPAAAQPVYETRDRAGLVFSDLRAPGEQAVTPAFSP